MKLLLDENLSDRIVPQILDLYPGSTHVKAHGLMQTSDTAIWSFAERYGYTVVSKDADFHQRSLLYGAPPKFVYLRVGNCPTSRVIELLRTRHVALLAFGVDPESSILVLPEEGTAQSERVRIP